MTIFDHNNYADQSAVTINVSPPCEIIIMSIVYNITNTSTVTDVWKNPYSLI